MAFNTQDVALSILRKLPHHEIEDTLAWKRGEVQRILDGGRELHANEAHRIVSFFYSRMDADDAEPKPIRYKVDDYLNAVEHYEYRQDIKREARRAVQQIVREELQPIMGDLIREAMRNRAPL